MERFTYAATGTLNGRTLSGVAHVYGSVTTDARKHSFAPGAFARSIAAGQVVSFAFHDDSKPLASQKAGSLRLQDGDQLGFEIDMPDTSYAADIRALKDSGFELGMSFAIAAGGKYERKNGGRIWSDVNLISVDPVALPAFGGTSVVLNSFGDQAEIARMTAIRLRHKAWQRA